MAKRRAAPSGSSADLSFSGARAVPHRRAKYFRGVALVSVVGAAALSLHCGSKTFDLLPEDETGGGQTSASGAGARAGAGGRVSQGGRNNPSGGFGGAGGRGSMGGSPVNPICAAHRCAQDRVSCAPCDDRCDEDCVCGKWCVGCAALCGDGLQCDPLTSDRCAPTCDDNFECRNASSETGEPLPFCRLGIRPSVCVQCVDNGDCDDEPREKFCHLGRCIECFEDRDCTTASLPLCNSRGRCVECTNGARHCDPGDVCEDGVCRH